MGSTGRSLLTAESALSIVGTIISSMYCLDDIDFTSASIRTRFDDGDEVSILLALTALF